MSSAEGRDAMSISEFRQTTTGSRRLLRWSSEAARFLVLPVGPTPKRVGKLYDIVGTSNLIGEETLFLNLGYWKNAPATIDEACADMARLVADAARLNTDDIVIDVGCGFGDQDFLWMRERGPSQIVGVNVSASQIRIANSRAAQLGFTDTVRFVDGAANNIGADAASATKVIALESGFHFPSRPDFFGEAYRVLAPGGRLVTADIIARPRREVSGPTKWMPFTGGYARAVFSQSGRKKMYSSDYQAALARVGFENVTVQSIRDDVFAPLNAFLRTPAGRRQLGQVHPVGRMWLNRFVMNMWGPWMDYVIVSADKPARASSPHGRS